MKRLIVLIALLALAVPAAFAAPPAGKGKPDKSATSSSESSNPAKACKAERASLGVEAFSAKYGKNHNLKNAFGKCVSGNSKTQTEEAQEDTLNAAKQCKAERTSLGVAAFNTKYGTNHNLKNAFGKCVSSKAKEQGSDDDD